MLKVVESNEASPRALRRARGRGRRIGLVAFACLIAIILAGGGLYWQATHSSVSADFLRSRIEAAAASRLPADARLAIGSTALSYRRGQGVILRLRDMELMLPGIATIAAAEVSSTTTLDALVRQRIDLQSVTVTDVDIAVSAAPQMASAASGAEFLRLASKELMDRVLQADDVMRDAGLRNITVRDATLHFSQLSSPGAAATQISEATWSPLAPGRSKAWLQIIASSGEGWDLTLERRQSQAGRALVVELEEMPITSIAPGLAAGAGGATFDAVLTLQARVSASADGAFSGLRGTISTGPGPLSLTGEDEINIVSAAATFSLDATSERANIRSGEIRTQSGQVAFEGVADLSALDQFTLLGRVRRGFLPTSIGPDRMVRLLGGGILARVDLSERKVDVERLHLITPQGSASAIGQASAEGMTPGLSFALSFTEMPANVVRALWPPFVAAKTRGWFDANVRSGVLGPATLQVALPPDAIGPAGRGKVLPRYAVVGSMPFRDAEFSPLKTFPTIRRAQGEIAFGDATATIVANSGIMSIEGRGDLDAGGTSLTIPELGRRQQRGDLSLELSGPAPALAQLSDTPPLSIALKRGIVAEQISGEATLSLDANIPLTEPDFTGVIPTFRLTLTDFTSQGPIDNRMIQEADLVLEGSPLSYTVKGSGVLDGLQASVDMIMGEGAPDQSAVTASLSDADRERLGFGLGRLLTGTVQASLDLAGEASQPIALDLKEARISLPFLGWEKGPGVPATASFIMDKTDAGVRISDLIVSGKGFEARGALTLGPDGRLTEMTLDKLALRPGDQLSAKVTAEGRGYDVQVRGAALDARAILRGVRSGIGDSSADIFPLRISLAFDSVAGESNVVLSGVSGSLLVTAAGLDAASVKGSTNDGQSFEWTMGRESGARVLRLFAGGGGALIRFAGIYSRVSGGNLVLDYSGPVGGVGAGVLVLRDFRVINEEALKPVLDTSSPREGMVHANGQAAGDLHFSQLRIPFRQEGWVITIDDAALRGGLIGATASGTVNIPGSAMALSGTIIPAFGINNIAGAIPILGAILGGGRNEGLVGITYKMFGPLDQPTLTMNPLSAIAPGIFRKIFEYR